jgi:hypothetical protein
MSPICAGITVSWAGVFHRDLSGWSIIFACRPAERVGQFHDGAIFDIVARSRLFVIRGDWDSA